MPTWHCSSRRWWSTSTSRRALSSRPVTALLLPVALQFHHHHVRVHPHGPPIGYIGIAIGAFLSWAGVPGPGEAALITGAAFAAKGRLDITTVLLVAFAGATIGGTLGWLVGRHVGETVAGAPGPLFRWRRRALREGMRFYERWGVLAVYFTPSWIAGVHKLRPAKFIPANAISGLIWALAIGLATYFAGPSVADSIGDIGLVGSILIACGVVAALVANLVRRRRKRRKSAP